MALPVPATQDTTFVGLYTLFYRDGKSNHLHSKNFRFHGKLQDAIQRGAKHCDIMGAKFHFVQPLISNLEVEEREHLGVKEE